MAKKKTTEKALNIDNILFNCRDYLRAARNSGSFFEKRDRIINNQANNTLKERENQAFEEVLILLEDTEVPETLDWSYFAPFDGFKKLLTEMNIYEYQLMIDREGKESHTLNSAIDNLNCIAGYYEEMETFVPDYD